MPTISTLLESDYYRIIQTTTPLDASQLNDIQRDKLANLRCETARHHALLGFQLKNSIPEELQKSRYVSLSHSENVAVLAVHRDTSQCIGVDIEALHRPINPKLRAKLTPSLEESQCVENLPSLALWSLKEALWKAWQNNSQGLIKDVTITHLEDGSPNKQIIFQGKGQAPCGKVFHWHLYELNTLKSDGTLFYLAVAFTHP
jgi:phosphopantetheinyl transferase (holo-ACP synthase)